MASAILHAIPDPRHEPESRAHRPRGEEGADWRQSAPRPTDLPRLERWLSRGLRPGRSGRIGAEYPLCFTPRWRDRHVVLYRGDRFLSHALLDHVAVEAGRRRLGVSMVGLVYTEPRQRGLGLASHCLSIASDRARAAGSSVLALWTDLQGFYERLGFASAGRETFLRVDRQLCRLIATSRSQGLCVRAARPDDWGTLEALYRHKPVHVLREPGRLRRLATIPDCRLLVAERDGRPMAYAAMGKGDDFPSVVHEWAGEAEAVLQCLEALLSLPRRASTNPASPHIPPPFEHAVLLASTEYEEPAASLERMGAASAHHPFAMLKLLDPGRAWRALAAGSPQLEAMQLQPAPTQDAPLTLHTGRAKIELDRDQVLALLFGPELPAEALEQLDPTERRAIEAHLPWPLFVWGFDSI